MAEGAGTLARRPCGGMPRPAAPPWIPAFAGMTVGGVRRGWFDKLTMAERGLGWRDGFVGGGLGTRLASTGRRPKSVEPRCPPSAHALRVPQGERPHSLCAPLSWFKCLTMSGRAEGPAPRVPRRASPPWIPAFAGMTVGGVRRGWFDKLTMAERGLGWHDGFVGGGLGTRLASTGRRPKSVEPRCPPSAHALRVPQGERPHSLCAPLRWFESLTMSGRAEGPAPRVPRLATLDSRFRGNDGGGWGAELTALSTSPIVCQ